MLKLTAGSAVVHTFPTQSTSIHRKPCWSSRPLLQSYTRAHCKFLRLTAGALSPGFPTRQHSARDALAEVLIRYVTEVGQLAHETAELAGRTEPNAIDVLAALEELGEHAHPRSIPPLCCVPPLRGRTSSRNVSHTSTPPLLNRVLDGQSLSQLPAQPSRERHSRLLPRRSRRHRHARHHGVRFHLRGGAVRTPAATCAHAARARAPPEVRRRPLVCLLFCPQRCTPALASPI